MIRFVCECGKQLQAREEHAGRLVLCPACQRQQQVPPLPPTAIQPVEVVEPAPARAGARRGPPPIRDEPEREEDLPRRRSPAGSSGKATASLVLGILSLCGCGCLMGLPSIAFGILSLRDIGRSSGKMTGKGMAITGLVLGSLATLCCTPSYFYGYFFKLQMVTPRMVSQNDLKQMGLAMHMYHDTYNGKLPLAAISDKNGKPLLSWRVALLPFIEQGNMYNAFKLDEPWDSPHNIKLLEKMPRTYKLPELPFVYRLFHGSDKAPPGYTHYQVFTGSTGATLFGPLSQFSLNRIPDGSSNTILIVAAEQAVPWTKPEDIPFDPSKPIKPLLSTYFGDFTYVLLADGSIRAVSRDISEKTLKLAITANDGEPLGDDW